MFDLSKLSRGVLLATFGSLLCVGCDIQFTMTDGYSFTYSGEQKEKTEEGDFDESVEKINIENRFGDVKIISAGADEPGWTWQATVWADTEEMAATLLEDMFLEVTTEGSTQVWELVLPESKSDLNGLSSNLTFRVPNAMQVRLKNSHGNVEATDLEGNLDAVNQHGDVKLQNLTGLTKVENSHGNLSAEKIAAADLQLNHGNATIGSAGGDIEFKGSHGNLVADLVEGNLKVEASHWGVEAKNVTDSAEISTTHNRIRLSEVLGNAIIKNEHGDIRATQMMGAVKADNRHGKTEIKSSGDSVSVNSQHGSVEITMTNPEFTDIEVETSHSRIEVSLPSSVSTAIEMETSHGKTLSDFETDDNSSQRVKLINRHGDIRIRKQDESTE